MDYSNDNINEQFLNLWLEISALINNDRLVSDLTFNEAHICNLLWRQSKCQPDYLTQTELCAKTGIIKSLMNRTLNLLEQKNLITRVRPEENRRVVQVRFNQQLKDNFLKEHQHSISIIDSLAQYWGEDNNAQILDSLRLIADAAKHTLGGKD